MFACVATLAPTQSTTTTSGQRNLSPTLLSLQATRAHDCFLLATINTPLILTLLCFHFTLLTSPELTTLLVRLPLLVSLEVSICPAITQHTHSDHQVCLFKWLFFPFSIVFVPSFKIIVCKFTRTKFPGFHQFQSAYKFRPNTVFASASSFYSLSFDYDVRLRDANGALTDNLDL